MQSFVAGFLLSLSLILAIGAQNAFVLRQGLRRMHVGAVVLACVLSEVALISAGVAGFDVLSDRLPWIGDVFLYGGVAFLFVYGAMSLRAAWRGGEALVPSQAQAGTWQAAVLTCLAITWLNPHVYLDTVVLVGSIAAQYPAPWVFGIGAMSASFLFFVALGYGAGFLAPVFSSARAWQVLEAIVGLTMWAIGLKLLLF